MFVRIRFTILFLISYIQLATRSFVLSFCGHFFSFVFSLFPSSLVIYTHVCKVCMYVYMYISITKVHSLPSYLSSQT